jgi:hypothetical protein
MNGGRGGVYPVVVAFLETERNMHGHGDRDTYMVRMAPGPVVRATAIIAVIVRVSPVVPIPWHRISRIIPIIAVSTHRCVWHRFEVGGGRVVV